MSRPVDMEPPEELIQSYLDGKISPEDEARLSDWLKASDSNMDEFVRQLEIHASLWENFTAQAGLAGLEAGLQPISPAAIRAAAAQRRETKSRQKGSGRAGAWLRYVVLPLAAAAALLMAIHLFNVRTVEQVLAAEVIDLRGNVTLTGPGGTAPAKVGDLVKPGAGLRTGPGASAKLKYSDGTTLELRTDTDLSLREHEKAKQVWLGQGEISAEVSQQPSDAPMVLGTPHGKAKVLGTRFTLSAAADYTRLDVDKGRVLLTREQDRKSIEVEGGYYAVAGAGLELVALPSAGTPPVVKAEADPKEITLPTNQVKLTGAVTDQDLPADKLTATWSKVSGPGQVAFDRAQEAATAATFDKEGVYVLRLAASDGKYQSHAEVTVTVKPAPANKPPVVAADGDLKVVLPAKAALRGEVTDDGLPNPPGKVTWTWSKAQGPGEVVFDNPAELRTAASFAKEGAYVLVLTATDGELQSKADLKITVEPAPVRNLLANPGFENDGQAWQTKGGGAVSIVKAPVHGGAKALQLLIEGQGEVEVSQDVAVTAGAAYEATGWVKVQVARKNFAAILDLSWKDAAGKEVRADRVGAEDLTADWKRFSKKYTAPATAKTVSVMLKARGNATGGGKAWFDDLSLQKEE